METLNLLSGFGGLQDTCPSLPYAQSALMDARELVKALRRLRQRTQRCEHCQSAEPGMQQPECLWIQDLNARLDLAIEEIMQEWGLA